MSAWPNHNCNRRVSWPHPASGPAGLEPLSVLSVVGVGHAVFYSKQFGRFEATNGKASQARLPILWGHYWRTMQEPNWAHSDFNRASARGPIDIKLTKTIIEGREKE